MKPGTSALFARALRWPECPPNLTPANPPSPALCCVPNAHYPDAAQQSSQADQGEGKHDCRGEVMKGQVGRFRVSSGAQRCVPRILKHSFVESKLGPKRMGMPWFYCKLHCANHHLLIRFPA